MTLYEFDRMKNAEFLCGIDEAGRGPLAGPVFAAAVILPKGWVCEEINDSKKLSEAKRELLFEIIKSQALSFSVALATEQEIDQINILNATMLAMQRAYSGLTVVPDLTLVDGNRLPELSGNAEFVIGGDAKSQSIAAASILAKVSRDRLMLGLDEQFPEYGFAKHKGYGTKMHMNAILTYGASPVHRKSFLKKFEKSREQ